MSVHEEFIHEMPIDVVIDLLTYIGYEVQVIESGDESRYRVTDLIPEPVVTREMDDQALRELLIEQLRDAEREQKDI